MKDRIFAGMVLAGVALGVINLGRIGYTWAYEAGERAGKMAGLSIGEDLRANRDCKDTGHQTGRVAEPGRDELRHSFDFGVYSSGDTVCGDEKKIGGAVLLPKSDETSPVFGQYYTAPWITPSYGGSTLSPEVRCLSFDDTTKAWLPCVKENR